MCICVCACVCVCVFMYMFVFVNIYIYVIGWVTDKSRENKENEENERKSERYVCMCTCLFAWWENDSDCLYRCGNRKRAYSPSSF